MPSEPMRARSPVSPGEIVGGKYRVEKVLGAGGMGVVVAAKHVELDQAVALKFILPEALADQGNLERFMREARAAVRLKSEHVARVYDVGRDAKDRPYMVLELLEGMDLARLNKKHGPLPVADAVEYVLQACEALVEAHAAGIVHRDLKPQNLFVTRRLNGTPLVKVLDFGISKAVGPAAAGQMALTDSAAIIGSPLYMAPEQMRSARGAEMRSDIWALGVILFELLGGQLPFEGETVTEVCIRVVNEAPPDLMSLRPALDQALVSVVMRALAKEPDARWQTVAQLAAALEPFSRSAKQGGVVRPWRSFEDTQDSQDPRPLAAALGAADATGPSTAVTMPTIDPDAVGAARSSPPPRVGTGTKPSATGDPPVAPALLVSTDVSWGEATGRRSERPRSFATGLFAGGAAALAVAAAAAFLVSRSAGTAPPAPSAAASAPVASVASPPKPPPEAIRISRPPAPTQAAPAEPEPATEPHPERPKPRRRHEDSRPSAKRPARAPAPAASSADRAPAAPTVRSTPTAPAPNGAPILR